MRKNKFVASNRVLKCPDCGKDIIFTGVILEDFDRRCLEAAREQKINLEAIINLEENWKEKGYSEAYEQALVEYVKYLIVWKSLRDRIMEKYNINIDDDILNLESGEVYLHE